jgi:hypothetical protein
MTPRPPRFAVALLERFVPDNEPLAGDLLEEWHQRSNVWFWRQVLFTIFVRTIVDVRSNARLAAESVLVAIAMLTLLGFHAVVAASLMNEVLATGDLEWNSELRHQDWSLLVAASWFAIAVLIGREIGRFHRDHRLAAILACSASATIAAFVNLAVFVQAEPYRPFFPDALMQIVVATVFIAGLFAGIGSRSRCEPQPLS